MLDGQVQAYNICVAFSLRSIIVSTYIIKPPLGTTFVFYVVLKLFHFHSKQPFVVLNTDLNHGKRTNKYNKREKN